MSESIDDNLLKAYALWGRNRVEFNRDSQRTLITFVWNEECSLREKSAICICRGGDLMRPAQSFTRKASETCYELCRGESVDEIVKVLEKTAPLEFLIHEHKED
jgi:hypothetical protein